MTRSLIPFREGLLRERFPRTLARFEEDMEEMFERLFGGREGWLAPREVMVPRMDMVESDKQLEITVDLPGLKPEEVTVELKDGELWISGEHKEEKEEKGKTFHRVERHHGEFRRVLPLPVAVNEQAIEARFEKGVLTVTLPKAPEAETRHIEIKTS
jgi:HSP20 family protein